MKSKKPILFITIILIFTSVFTLFSCSNENGYKKVVTCIKRDNLSEAVEYCAQLSDDEIETGKNEILGAINKKLNALLKKTDSWCCNSNDGIIEQETITDFYCYKRLISLIGAENTEEMDFIDAVVSLSEYSRFNDCYKILESKNISNGLDYVAKAEEAGTSYLREQYYKSAYDCMNAAYNESLRYSTQSYGIEILKEYTLSWIEALSAWQNGQTSYERDKFYDQYYKMISREYEEAIGIVKETIELFPAEI